MKLYRFLSNHVDTYYVAAENGKAAVEAVEATGIAYDNIIVVACESALPEGSVAKLLIVPAPSPIVTTPKDVWDSLRGGNSMESADGPQGRSQS